MGTKNRPNLSPRTLAAILHDARAGVKYTDIARKYGWGVSCIRAHVRAAGIAPRAGNFKPYKVTPEKAQKIARAWQAGEKAIAIAAELGLSLSTVRAHRVLMGLPPRTWRTEKRTSGLL